MRSELRADRIEALEAENARLRAELEANAKHPTVIELVDRNVSLAAALRQAKEELEVLRPKPVVETCEERVEFHKEAGGLLRAGPPNLKLTFTDHVLTAAEVIK